jgi:hypothetical protein
MNKSTDRRSAQIARDIREGTFPEKSPMTVLEDRIEVLEAALTEIFAECDAAPTSKLALDIKNMIRTALDQDAKQ